MKVLKKLFKPLLLTFLYISISASTGYGQDSLVKDLKEVTIIATRTEKNLFDAARDVSVITSEDIRKSNYSSLGDLLSQEVGLYIPGSGQTPGSNQSIFLQGANSNQTSIFMDGVRITDPSTVNNVIDLSEISIQDIEKIEIIRGSHSTLYGSAAIGGLINITTKIPDKAGLSTKASFTTGTFGPNTSVISPMLGLGYKFKNGFYVSALVDYTKVNGLDATIDTITDPSVFKNRDSDDYKKIFGSIHWGYKREKTEIKLNYNNSKSETDIDKSAFTDDNNNVLKFNRDLLSGSVSHSFNKGVQVTLSGGASWTERNALNDSSIISAAQEWDHQYTKDSYSGLSTNIDLIIERKRANWDLIFGTSRSTEEMSSENYFYFVSYFDPMFPFVFEDKSSIANSNSKTVSAYSQIELNGNLITEKLNKLNIVSGLRFDYHDLFKEHFSFEINPSWKFNKSSLVYLAYSSGYNSPSLYQLYAPTTYIPWDGSKSAGITLGNKFLKPEKSRSVEIGYKQKLSENTRLSISLFQRTVTDNIEYVDLWDARVSQDLLGTDYNVDDYRGATYINTGTSTIYGANLSVQFLLLKNLKASGGVSLVGGNIKYKISQENSSSLSETHIQLYNNGYFLNAESQKKEGLIRRPNILMAQLNYSGIKMFEFNLTGKLVDEREDVYYDTQIQPYGALNTIKVEAYFLLDFNLCYHLNKHLLISAKLENILDEQYSEIRGFRTRGRSLYLKLAFRF